MIINFPMRRRHAGAASLAVSSRRAASAAIESAVTPAAFAAGVAKIDGHHSAGILSLCHHFETCCAVAPLPAASAHASRVGHSSMIARNDFMPATMGQPVPKSKAIMSGDCGWAAGHYVPMEDEAETEWRAGFHRRFIAAQGARTNAVMAGLLGISETRYSKYRGSRKSMMPIRLLPKFCNICGITLEYLIEGARESGKKPLPKPPIKKRVAG